MKPETKLTHDIIRALNQIPGVYCWRRNVGVRAGIRFGKAGMADIEGILAPRGQRLELEVKIDTKLTEKQSEWLQTMQRFGAAAACVHSINEAIDFVVRQLHS